MKKFLLSIACTAVAALTFGQKDISVTLTSPADGDVITQGVNFDFEFTITHNGPDDLVLEDSVYFGITVDGNLVTPGVYLADRTNGAVTVGGTWDFASPFGFSQLPDNNTHDICVVVLLQDSDSSYTFVTETNMLDNQSCANVQFAGASAAGVTEIAAASYNVTAYPNPATSVVNFELSQGAEEIVIYDVNGKAVKTIAVENTLETVNVADLENGVYFYAVKFENGEVKQERLVVSK